MIEQLEVMAYAGWSVPRARASQTTHLIVTSRSYSLRQIVAVTGARCGNLDMRSVITVTAPTTEFLSRVRVCKVCRAIAESDYNIRLPDRCVVASTTDPPSTK